MKKIIFIIGVLYVQSISAQILKPVKLSFSSNKIDSNIYEVHLKAQVDTGWHIFSQYSEQDDGIGPLPTSITFKQNDMVAIQGKPKEVGELQEKFEEVFEVNTKCYYNEVVFVQKVKTKTNKPVILEGTITYMACKDEQCLTPQEVEFEVVLN
ncbi:MAG TPA: protein-disulfide reductase DsbD domain-containing protein [Flavobacteriaceae bacterium]|jgi:hypothetical protein